MKPVLRPSNPNHVDNFSIPSYKDLGWQLDYLNPVLVKCREAGHKTREHDNSFFLLRGTDVIYICDECKYIHHTDMSD